MEIKSHDDFVMIKHSDLHEIKLIAHMMTTFMQTYQAYNRKLNAIIKMSEKITKIGE